ncbi:Regulator of nonsense transcripts 2 [Eumeta japonica]|uniref:Regulator of nonsense transcripts 2 n=1 Tax=Eumeta variegata TaxID=151549 RepID=A0A4C1TT92_EUMVA|nr:Regulator of nonsense transcripts 2 [Eumeta japonica]
MNTFLDQMMRLKTALLWIPDMLLKLKMYYLVKPPETVKNDVKLRPVIHEYIRHLIFEELNKQNVERCIKMLRRINWHDPTISSYVIKCLSKAYLLRFPLIRCLADLLSGLSSYQEKAVTMVIDNVFEDIRAGLEIHSPKLAQRRIAMANPKLKLYKNLEQAKEAIKKLKEKLYPQLKELTNQSSTEETAKNLHPIPEDSEFDDADECKPVTKTKEDLEFEQLFEKMAQDSYQERLKEAIKPNTKDIPVPMMVKQQKSYEQISTTSIDHTVFH